MHDAQQKWCHERAFLNARAEQAEHFAIDLIAPPHEGAVQHALYLLEVAYALIGNIAGQRVLDVGCGYGDNSLLFAGWGADVTGVNISPGAIEVSRARAKEFSFSGNAKFIVKPFEQVATYEHKFDVVWSAAFLHHKRD